MFVPKLLTVQSGEQSLQQMSVVRGSERSSKGISEHPGSAGDRLAEGCAGVGLLKDVKCKLASQR